METDIPYETRMLNKLERELTVKNSMLDGRAARIAELEAENARLREACEAARKWLNYFGAEVPIVAGGEAELDEQLRAALS